MRPFGNVVYLMPAFTIALDDLDTLCTAVVDVVSAWSERLAEWTK